MPGPTEGKSIQRRFSDTLNYVSQETWRTFNSAKTLLSRSRTNTDRDEETKDKQPILTNRQLLREASEQLSASLNQQNSAVLYDRYIYFLCAAAKALDPLFGYDFLLMSVSSDNDLNKLIDSDFVFKQTKPSKEEREDLLSACDQDGIYLRILSNRHESIFTNELLYASKAQTTFKEESFTERKLKEIEFVALTVSIARTEKLPIIIRQDEKYFVYGLFDNQAWKLTALNDELTSSYYLPFPDYKEMEQDGSRLSYNGKTYEGLYQHIAQQTTSSLTINEEEEASLLEQIIQANAELDYHQIKTKLKETIESRIIDGSNELYSLINKAEEELSEIESTIERVNFVLQLRETPPDDKAIEKNQVYLYLNKSGKVEYAFRCKNEYSTRLNDPGHVTRKELIDAMFELPEGHGIHSSILGDIKCKLMKRCLLTPKEEAILFCILNQVENMTQRKWPTPNIKHTVETLNEINQILQHKIARHNREIEEQQQVEASAKAQLQKEQQPIINKARRMYRAIKAQTETHPEIDFRPTKLLCELMLERPNSGRITFSLDDIMHILEQIDTPYVPPPIATHSPLKQINYSIVFAGLVLMASSALLIVLSHGLSAPISYMGIRVATDMIASAVFCTTMVGAVTCNIGMFCGSRKTSEEPYKTNTNLSMH